MEKAYVFPRVLAYFIDVIIISILATLLCSVLPNQENLDTLEKEYTSLQEKYLNAEIDDEEYVNQTKIITYDIDYQSVPSSIISISLYLLYFVIFQNYNKGQTLGKKIMKVKIVSNDDQDLTINNYLYRSCILNGLLVNLINLILVLFMDRNYYFYVSFTLQFIQIVLILITIFMVLFKKDGRGLHDKVANTKVVMAE